MTIPQLLLVLIVIVVLLFVVGQSKEKFKLDDSFPYPYIIRTERQRLPERRFLDSVSGNNMLTFIGEKPDKYDAAFFDPDYQSSLCLLRKSEDAKRACSSVDELMPMPQTTGNPKKFVDF